MIKHYLEDNIIRIELTGNITYQEIVEFSKKFSEYHIKGDILLILYDLNDAVLNFSVSEYKEFSRLANEATKGYRFVKAAFITNTPQKTAMLTIFSHLTNTTKTQRKVFSTKDAALAWLQFFNKY